MSSPPVISAVDPGAPQLPLFGVTITDVSMRDAIGMLEALMRERSRCHSVYFVNAHTLNLALADPSYSDVLRQGDRVFGDGTGVRWAARALRGVRLKDNVNGTDLIPAFFAATSGRGYRYFLLGATADAIEKAASYARRTFAGWQQVGFHHGYLDEIDDGELADIINASGADMLLVGMGNPKQEQWIHAHRNVLQVPLCMGVGGLFTYWSGDLERAPAWMRRLGYEWVHLTLQQPHKMRRYLIGNPQFLWHIVRHWVDRHERTE